MEELYKTKELIENYIKYHNAFSNRVYSYTNENIKSYLNNFDFNDKNSALSVLSSGDQVFNLIHNGITNIDTFDSNYLTEFYSLGIKKSMILKYNYKDFLHKYLDLLLGYYSIYKESIFIEKLLPYMDNRYAIFWNELVKFNYDLQSNNSDKRLLISDIVTKRFIMKDRIKLYNNYLSSNEDYEILKDNLLNSKINFSCLDILDISNKFNNKYDFILLSNIFDYLDSRFKFEWNYSCLKEEINKMNSMLNNDGVILIHYLFKCIMEDNKVKGTLIAGSNVKYNDLTNEELCYFDFSDNKNYSDNMKDAVIYVRKK